MLHNARLSRCQRNTTATALRLKHNYYCKPKMPRVGSPLEAFVVAYQAYKLTWQRSILAAFNELHLSQRNPLQPDHKTQNTESVKNLEKRAKSQASKFGKPDWF